MTTTAHLEAVPTSVAEIPLQPASQDIWDKKYRLKAKNGTPVDESIDSTYQRVARALADAGVKLFLDAKLLDIPNTVEGATANISRLGVSFLTVHGTDRKTLDAAAQARLRHKGHPRFANATEAQIYSEYMPDPARVSDPAQALAIIMFAFNFLGDGLRDALDPRLRGTQ